MVWSLFFVLGSVGGGCGWMDGVCIMVVVVLLLAVAIVVVVVVVIEQQ